MSELNLSALKFSVDTAELQKALTDTQKLRKAIGEVDAPLSSTSNAANKTIKTVDNLGTSVSKATEGMGKAVEGANKKQDAFIKSLETKRKYLSEGFTVGESSALSFAEKLGFTGKSLEQVMLLLKDIGGLVKNPFDSAIGSIRSVTKEIEELQLRTNLATDGMVLSSRHLKEYSRIGAEVSAMLKGGGVDPTSGAGLEQYNKIVQETQNQYLGLVTKAEEARSVEQSLAKQHRDTANATRNAANEMERAKSTLAALNATGTNSAAINEKAAAKTARFAQMIRQSGVDAKTAQAKIKEYADIQNQIQSQEQDRRINRLSGALAPQISDVLVSLQGGMNPLTVMMQQGMQVRDLIGQSQVDAANLAVAFRKAGSNMVSSIRGTAVAIGSMLGGTILDVGKSISTLGAKALGLNGILESTRAQIAANAGSSSLWIRALSTLGTTLSFLTGILAGSLLIGLGALAVGFYKAFTEGEKLSKQMALTGGAFGLTKDRAYALADSMNAMGVTTGAAVATISEITKYSVLASQDIKELTKSAVDMEKYAGVAIADTVKAFADLAKDPVEGIIKLATETGKVSPAVVQLVNELVQQGKTTEAVTVAINAMKDANKATTDQIVADYGYVMNSLQGVKKFFGGIWDAILGAGRADTLSDKLKSAEERLKRLGTMGSQDFGGTFKAQAEEDVKRLKAAMAFADLMAEQEKRKAAGASAYGELIKKQNDALSKQEKLKKELAQIDESVSKARSGGFVYDDSAVKKLKDAAREKYKEKGSSSGRKEKSTFEKASETYRDLVAQSNDYTSSFNNQKAELELLREKGKLADGTLFTQEMYNAAYDALISKQPFAIEYEKQKKKEQEEQQKLLEAQKKDQEIINDLLGNAEGLQSSWNNKAEAIWREFDAGRLTIEKALAAFKELDKQSPEGKRLEKVQQLRDEMQAQLDIANEEYNATVKQLEISSLDSKVQKEITDNYDNQKKYLEDMLKIKKNLNLTEEERVQQESVANQLLQVRSKTSAKSRELDDLTKIKKYKEELASGLTDAIITGLTEGGEAGSKKLRDLVVAELQKPIKLLIEASIKTALGGGTGSTGGDIFSQILDFGSKAVDWFTGTSSAMASESRTSAKEMTKGGGMGSSSTFSMSNLSSAFGDALAGLGIQKGLSNGYKVGDGKAVDALTMIGSAIFGPLAGVVGGIFNQAFGRKLTETGIKGTYNKDGTASATGYKFEKGGWLRSDKTTEMPIPDKQAKKITDQMLNVREGTARMIETLGLSAESVRAFTGEFRANFMGLSEEEALKKWEEELLNLQGRMAESVPGLEAFAKAGETAGEAFKRLATEVQTAIAEAGISAEGLSAIIRDGMLGKLTQEQVGQKMADVVIGGIYNTIVGGVADQIAAVFMTQIIQPIFTAIIAGVPLSQAVSQAAIAKVMQTAKESIAALGQILKNPEFVAMINDLKTLINEWSGVTTSTATDLPVYTSDMYAYSDSMSAANSAAQEAKRIADERYNLETRLLELQGNTVALRQRELDKLDPSNRALQQQIWLLEDQKEALDEAKRKWESLSTSIISEIEKIKNEILGNSPAAEKISMALFNDLTSKARSGDADAADKLPELAQDILKLAGSSAVTLADLQKIRSQMLVSLDETNRIIKDQFLSEQIMGDGSVGTPSDTSVQTPEQNIIVNVDNSNVVEKLQGIADLASATIATQQATTANIVRLTKLFDRISQGSDTLRVSVV